MSALNIPVEISQPMSGMLPSILNELVQHLQNLIENGQPHSIDLARQPLTSIDLIELEKLLGKGELSITLNTIGDSEIFETAFSGIWWVKHYTADQVLISQFIEITNIPDIIKSQPEDMQLALSRLKSQRH